MAKATAYCTCHECGEVFVKTAQKYNRREADDWEAWAKRTYTQCPKCWGANKRKEELEQPITLIISLNPHFAQVILHFEGNTMPAKDDIKRLGYVWSELPSAGIFGALDFKRAPNRWHKIIEDIESLDAELEAVKVLNPEIKNNFTKTDLAMFAKVKKEKDEKKENERRRRETLQHKIDVVPKPSLPDLVAGKHWNQKLYGKSGYYTVYLDDCKVSLSDEEAKVIRNYLQAKKEYQKIIDEILKSDI